MSDIPVTDKTQGEEKVAPAPANDGGAEKQQVPTGAGTPNQEVPQQPQQNQGTPIQRGNVDLLTLQLLAEIRDEIRLLRLLVQTGGQQRPPQAPPSQPGQPQK